jgi:integrase
MKFREVMDLYANRNNPAWVRLAPRSKAIYSVGMKHLKRFYDVDVDKITRPMIVEWRDDYYDYPGRLRPALNVLNNILNYAHDHGWVEYNQAARLRGLPGTKPHARWDDERFETFIANVPQRIRLAMMLALYTGQRRVDLVNMKWEDYDGEYISVWQQKTSIRLSVPVHKRLKAELDQTKRVGKTILVNSFGQRWNPDSLNRAIKMELNRLGMSVGVGQNNDQPLRLHGLRKSAAAKLAEAGCTPHQIAAITGHKSLKQVEHYTNEANQKRLATEAIAKWI